MDRLWTKEAEFKEANPRCLDADIKAYFRTVNVQIRDWQENRGGDADDTDPNDLSYCKAYNCF